MKNIEIKIPSPNWNSKLTGVILDLEKLRSRELYGEVPPYIFFELKFIFQILETLGSARIEGNNTTLSDYVEKIIDKNSKKDESQKEISNLDKAIEFIEQNTKNITKIDRAYVSELHKIIMKDLTPPPKGEGSYTPGSLRKCKVIIKNSKHSPPDYVLVPDYFDGLVKLINEKTSPQNQLLMIAIAHHRFAYIHPFDNGNGRMGRLLNYALLIKSGFNVKDGRIINPSAVFYTNRNQYYKYLAKADTLKDNDVLAWSEYFLLGLKNEIEKIDKLLSSKYIREKILIPTITFALENKYITDVEFKVLDLLFSKKNINIKSIELSKIGINGSVRKSRVIQRLRKKKILYPLKKGGRIYSIRFRNNYLLRGIVEILRKEGFVSDFLNRK